MTKPAFEQMISRAVEEVLETMFFAAPLGPAVPENGGAVLEARLSFYGVLSGNLGVRLSAASARTLAAGFLGAFGNLLWPTSAV